MVVIYYCQPDRNMKKIVDYITGNTIYSKVPEKTVKEILTYHNSTFAYYNSGVHYPENAIAEDLGDTIVIRKRR